MEPEASSAIGKLSYTVSKLEKKIDFLFAELKIEYKENEELYITEAKKMIAEGNETEAVKYVRNKTGSGLIEAKMMVDEIKKKL